MKGNDADTAEIGGRRQPLHKQLITKTRNSDTHRLVISRVCHL